MKRILLALALTWIAGPAGASDVRVSTTPIGRMLTVDGRPFFIKGVGCNTAVGEKGEDYMAMAKAMGANAVRTWGVTQRPYFDAAQANGLMVDAGVWFNPIRGTSPESYRNRATREKLKRDTLAYVHEMKDHPALLMWNLGNEVFAFTESEMEKEAFGRFLEDLVKSVKKEDPNHPVTYACAGKRDLAALRKYVPSLDIVGVNTYGGFPNILRDMVEAGDLRPVVATEFGPHGAWDMKKDASGLAFEPYDHIKSANYEGLWKQIEVSSAVCVGGFAFVLGEMRNQDSLTWWNINVGAEKREAYAALQAAYTGREPSNHAPRIRLLKVDRVTDLDPGAPIEAAVTASDADGDALSYEFAITDVAHDPLIVEQPRFYPLHQEILSPDKSKVRVRVPNDPGAYRLYAFVRDGKGNIAVATRGLKVTPPATE